MLDRFFVVLHWIVYLAFFGIWTLFFLALIIGSPEKVFDDLGKLFEEESSLNGVLFSGAMTWIPLVFLFIDYVVNDKWTWFPWQRGN
jgi:glucose-6-phosphate-specific signal transduction histidine kinase